jgi:hypothetical protein
MQAIKTQVIVLKSKPLKEKRLQNNQNNEVNSALGEKKSFTFKNRRRDQQINFNSSPFKTV